MKTKKRIEKWLADENFRRYAEKRMQGRDYGSAGEPYA